MKDVRLPLQLQRAMAAEAEATREAGAKVFFLLSTGSFSASSAPYVFVKRQTVFYGVSCINNGIFLSFKTFILFVYLHYLGIGFILVGAFHFAFFDSRRKIL